MPLVLSAALQWSWFAHILNTMDFSTSYIKCQECASAIVPAQQDHAQRWPIPFHTEPGVDGIMQNDVHVCDCKCAYTWSDDGLKHIRLAQCFCSCT